jgi:nucleotide-binding universal stress UspA family protein
MRAKLIEAPTIHGVERLRRAELPAGTIELAHVGKTLARYLPSKSRHFACAAPCADHPAIDLAGVSEAMATNWLNEAASQASAEALKDAIGKSDGARVAFKALTRTGQTAEAIAQVAREEEVEHIVMGTRGLGGIQGLLLGSVATQVIHLAELPITLIK